MRRFALESFLSHFRLADFLAGRSFRCTGTAPGLCGGSGSFCPADLAGDLAAEVEKETDIIVHYGL